MIVDVIVYLLVSALKQGMHMVLSLDPRPSDLVFSWRAWFVTITWGKIEVEPTLLGVGSPQSHHDNDLQPPGISVVERSAV